jgi:hypothetical protein
MFIRATSVQLSRNNQKSRTPMGANFKGICAVLATRLFADAKVPQGTRVGVFFPRWLNYGNIYEDYDEAELW